MSVKSMVEEWAKRTPGVTAIEESFDPEAFAAEMRENLERANKEERERMERYYRSHPWVPRRYK